VILVAVAWAFILAGLLLTFYLMPRSKSEPGETIVPDDASTPDAPVVPDDAPAGPRQRRVAARWIAALGLTVVGLIAWFVLARPFGGSGTGHASVGSGTGRASVVPSTSYSSVVPSTSYSSVVPATEDPKTRLTTGVCFLYVDASAVDAVPCTQWHDHEAYHRYSFPPGPFPGDDAVWAAALVTCHAQLERYVGPGHLDDYYVSWMLRPDRPEWAAGNRITICVLSRSDGEQITGSAHQAH